MKVSIVAGGAGFIGANLFDRLLGEDRTVVVIDNLLRGSRDYLNVGEATSRLIFIKADLAKRTYLYPYYIFLSVMLTNKAIKIRSSSKDIYL